MKFHKSRYRTESTFGPKTLTTMAVFTLEDALSVWTELSSVVRCSSSTTEDSSSERIMRPQSIIKTANVSERFTQNPLVNTVRSNQDANGKH